MYRTYFNQLSENKLSDRILEVFTITSDFRNDYLRNDKYGISIYKNGDNWYVKLIDEDEPELVKLGTNIHELGEIWYTPFDMEEFLNMAIDNPIDVDEFDIFDYTLWK